MKPNILAAGSVRQQYYLVKFNLVDNRNLFTLNTVSVITHMSCDNVSYSSGFSCYNIVSSLDQIVELQVHFPDLPADSKLLPVLFGYSY
jgi:hypothetical protein